jgi:hypothetical protein
MWKVWNIKQIVRGILPLNAWILQIYVASIVGLKKKAWVYSPNPHRRDEGALARKNLEWAGWKLGEETRKGNTVRGGLRMDGWIGLMVDLGITIFGGITILGEEAN